MTQQLTFRLFLFVVLALSIVCCGDDDTEDDTRNVNTPSSSDDADTETDSDHSVDSLSPYEGIDCSGRGVDPANCEYEICFHKQMYDQLVERCGAGCEAERQCYTALADCMKTACPVETLVPEDKSAAGIYTCKNTFDEDCMAQLP